MPKNPLRAADKRRCGPGSRSAFMGVHRRQSFFRNLPRRPDAWGRPLPAKRVAAWLDTHERWAARPARHM